MFQKFIIFLLLFSIPFQTRIFLYNSNFNVGIGTIWNSIFIYFTDLIIFLLFCLWIKNKKYLNIKISKIEYFLFGFFAISIISLIKTSDFFLGVLKIIKLFEFIWLYLFFKNYSVKFVKNFSIPIILSAVVQSFIAIAQFLYQHSLGLKILGEPFLNPYLSGVAKITTIETTLIRGYGTMPHPNILAAFLLIAIVVLLQNHLSENDDQTIKDIIYLFTFIILSFSTILTFSRTAIFLWILINTLFIISKFKNYPIKSTILIITIIIFSTTVLFLISPELKARIKINFGEQAVNQRILYSNISFKIIKTNWLIGVGIGNYINYLKSNFRKLQLWQYEPVHNIFFLIASEAGIFGLLIFLVFLFSLIIHSYRNEKEKCLILNKFYLNPFKISLILIILFFGLFDHFFWTLQSGNLMLWLMLGII